MGALTSFALICVCSLLWGGILAGRLPLSFANDCSITLQFVLGILATNTFLFALSLVSPLGLGGNLLILAATAVVWRIAAAPHVSVPEPASGYLPDMLGVAVCGVGATLWCLDSLHPVFGDEVTTIFRTWQDRFYHTRLISMFAQSHGLWSMTNIEFVDAPSVLYHYAIYFLPGVVLSMSDAAAYEVFASFLIPVGVLLAGLAAFSLVATTWGAWPALAAALAISMLPDAYQQGFGNRYLSFNFFLQVSPGTGFGIACAALAWIFILDACKTGRYALLLAGYGGIALCLLYKAHLFVANSYLAMIYPCVFFVRLSAVRRLVSAIGFTALFVVVVVWSQSIGGVPILRLDGSSAAEYLSILYRSYDPGFLKSVLADALVAMRSSPAVAWFKAVSLLVFSTFGIWIIAYGIALRLLGRQHSPAVAWFPIAVLFNYIVMSLGLAMDTRGIGTADELLNRPMVWAYFVVVAWAGATLYVLFLGSAPPGTRHARLASGIIASLSLAIPLTFSRDLQTFPTWRGFETFAEFASAPSCLVKASLYVRDHSHVDDIVQDSHFDRTLLVSAISERQAYAVDGRFRTRRTSELTKRFADLATLHTMTDASTILDFLSRRRIAWYVLQPITSVAWPASLMDNYVYECQGHRVYRFSEAR